MNSDVLNKYSLHLLSIISFIRFGAYLYWIYYFRVFILPVIFITEEGLFLLEQVPMILSAIDLFFVLLFLLSKGKTWFLLLINSFVSTVYSWRYLIGFVNLSSILGTILILLSILQIVILLNIYLVSKSVSAF